MPVCVPPPPPPYTHTCTYVHAHTHEHTYVHTQMHAYTCTHMSVHPHTCIHAYTHMCTHTRARTHTHTHTHTLSLSLSLTTARTTHSHTHSDCITQQFFCCFVAPSAATSCFNPDDYDSATVVHYLCAPLHQPFFHRKVGAGLSHMLHSSRVPLHIMGMRSVVVECGCHFSPHINEEVDNYSVQTQ